jgi:hypothetical protein
VVGFRLGKSLHTGRALPGAVAGAGAANLPQLRTLIIDEWLRQMTAVWQELPACIAGVPTLIRSSKPGVRYGPWLQSLGETLQQLANPRSL